ncbi:hypothetical protein [Pontibacter sp. G13]|uniref:hypothetical protein n=1 Tax=Pontibacter sp. G13 TaxID=3074898 RepID=UPI00288AF8CB|nr:hypothetical protein [Pontibacter sp. G13]WNJ20097.1 hypothetical protein RJD25_06395 [Pontibacter sp. G13]
MFKKTRSSWFLAGAVALGLTACQQELVSPDETSLGGGSGTPYLTSLIDLDYLTGLDAYVISGLDNTGNPAFYYGTKNNWTSIQVPSNISMLSTCSDSTYEAEFDGTGNFVFAFHYKGALVTNTGQFTGGQVNFGPTLEPVGTGADQLVEFVELDYVPSKNYYVLNGKTASGELDTYYGMPGSWTRLNNNRDAGKAWGAYQASAYDDGRNNNGKFKGIYAFIFNNGIVATNGLREFYNKPYFDTGKNFVGIKGDRLVSVISLDYLPSENQYVIQGMSESGDIDTYIGTHKSWTKTANKYDAENAWGDYKAIAFDDDPDGNGKFSFMYAYFRTNQGAINVNGGYEFKDGGDGEQLDQGGNVIKKGGKMVRHNTGGGKVRE